MKDLIMLYKTARSNVESLGIEVGNIISVKPNNRAKSRWGQCKIEDNSDYWWDTTYSININSRLLEDDIKDEKVISVIIHEILHTCEGCFNHGNLWKKYADLVNDCYSCYSIERTQCSNYFGISVQERIESKKYKVVCGECGHIHYRNRMFDTSRCTCGHCKGHDWKVYKQY
jgi:hypothetical protein